MAEQPKPQHHEMWSAISPGDLGLKAGFWTGKEKDPLDFKSIVGWVSVVSRTAPSDTPPQNGFHPVVLADNMYPVGAPLLPRYCGVFLKEMTESEAKRVAATWRNASSGVEPQPNVKGTGVA